MSDSLNRRDFLFYGGATVAGVTLGEVGRRWLARADAQAGTWRPTATESWANSVCRECPAGCGVRVRLMDRTPVKLEGNPRCPIARGRLCAKGQAAIEAYFDPDRLTGPARRSGRGADRPWTRISWDEALGLLTTRLASAAGKEGAVLALAADERGPIADAWTRFWSAQHARLAWTYPATADRLAVPFAAMTGAEGVPVFDLEHATYALSFGAPLVEDWLSPVWAQRSYGRFRRGSSHPRGRLVQIDGRRSLTARKADEWLPVAAERQAALACGIAAILLREDRVDRRALAEYGGTFAAFERDLVTQYVPDTVATATGVPVVTLLRLARELMSTSRPLVVVAADAAPDLVGAVFVLNLLIGALDRSGGVLESPVTAPTEGDRISASRLLREMASKSDRPQIVALRDASALRALATPRDAAKLFERCDLVVSFSPYLDDTASVADLILPTHTPLESWHGVVPASTDGRATFACAKPAAEPRLDTRDLVEILRATAGKMGGAIAAACPLKDSEDVVRTELDRLWKERRGTPYAELFETEWTRQLERGGWWMPPAASSAEFSNVALGAGGWIDPYFEPGQLRQTIARRGGLTFAPLPQAPDTAAASTPGVRTDRDFPLRLVAFTPAVVNLVGGPNQPVLFELLGQPDGAPWQVWAEIGGETARLFGIEHGASVRVTSAAGSIDVVALVAERTPPGTLVVAYVPALARGGRWAQLVQADVRQLFAGGEAEGSTAVRVTRL